MRPLGPGRPLRLAPLAITIGAHAAVIVLAGYGMGGTVRARPDPVSQVVYVRLASPAAPAPVPALAASKDAAPSRQRRGPARESVEQAARPVLLALPMGGERLEPAVSLAALEVPRPWRGSEPVPATAVATSAVEARGVADREPAYLSTPKPEYPEDARAEEEEGLVLLRVLVSARGVAEQVLVGRSSGSRSLDSAAVAGVKRWTFVPARRHNRDAEAWMEVPVRFVLR